MTETVKKKRAVAPKTAKQPEIVKIAWWNRPITWGLGGLFLMFLVVSSLVGTGGPETGEAQEAKAEVVVESDDPADRTMPVTQGQLWELAAAVQEGTRAEMAKLNEPVEPKVIVRIVKVPEIVTIRTPVITADNGAVVIQGSRNVRVDRSTTVNPPQRTPSKSASRGQRGVEELDTACDEFEQQHKAITARWASLLN